MLKQASRHKRVKNTKGGTIQSLSRTQLTFFTLATLVFLPTKVGRGLPCYWNISRLECTTYVWWVSRATARPALLWVPLSMTINDNQWQSMTTNDNDNLDNLDNLAALDDSVNSKEVVYWIQIILNNLKNMGTKGAWHWFLSKLIHLAQCKESDASVQVIFFW